MNRSDLFISGDHGYHTYRIPSLVVGASGIVIAFCEARRHSGRDDDEIDILLRRSLDGGITWKSPELVVSDGDRTCGNPCPVADARGAIFLTFCKNNQQVFAIRSDDDGLTWTASVEITAEVADPAWSYLGTGPGHGIQLSSGRLLIPCWCDESPGEVTWREPAPDWGKIQSSYAFFSDDAGVTWQRGDKMTTDASDECEAVEVKNGRVYMTTRSRQGRRCRSFAWSRDGGATWSDVEYDTELPGSSCQGSIVRLDAQRVLLAHPADEDERARLTVSVSGDECRTWQAAGVLEDGASAYSDLAVAPGGAILCFYEADSYARLVLARFDPAWIDS